MWRVTFYQGNELMIDHSQMDFGRVLRFTMQGLAELHNQNCDDYRVVMSDKRGDVYFFAAGPKTQLVNFVNREGLEKR
jgi:hypothetical protein